MEARERDQPARAHPLPALLALGLLAFTQGCGDQGRPAVEEAPRPATAIATAFEVDALADARVTGIHDAEVQLRDGRFEGPPLVEGSPLRPQLRWLPEIVHTADLDDDGDEEAVAFFSYAPGGTGHFLYVAWMEPADPHPVARAVHALGDRVQIESSSWHDGALRLRMIAHGPDDAACCPRQIEDRTLHFVEGAIESTTSIVGRASYDEIAGTRWRLERLDLDLAPSTDLEITLALGADGRVSGSAGCNRFTGEIIARENTDLGFGPLATTKMGCPPPIAAIEDDFLARLATVNRWSFLMGRLALGHTTSDGYATLLFVPIPEADDAE